MKLSTLITTIVAFAVMAAPAVAATNGKTLDAVKKRGNLRCQVSSPSGGFYNLDADGNWYGLDIAVCEAVAAAIFGDKNKKEIQVVATQQRYTALANGGSDLLCSTATNTMTRDTQLGVDFLQPNFYDGQGFTVLKSSGITSALQLKGAKVCVTSGTSSELNLADFSRVNNLNITAVTFDDWNVRDATYLKGGCDAVTVDKSSLAANKISFEHPADHLILPETISKEPLGPAVRQGDSQWAGIVKWSLYAMINAEELGITSANVDDMRANSKDVNVRRMLGVEGALNKGLGLSKDWAYNIIKQVGNYGENYEKYIGSGKGALGIQRKGTLNELWTNGGLMYSPPMR